MSARSPIEYEDASSEVRAVYDDIRATRQTDYINNFGRSWPTIPFRSGGPGNPSNRS